MIIYVQLAIVSITYFIFLLLKGKKELLASSVKRNLSEKVFWRIVTVFLVCVVGLRSKNIGIDTYGYVDFYEYMMNMPLKQVFSITSQEKGFLVFSKMLALLKMPYGVFLLACAVVSIVPIMSYISKNSHYPYLSLIIYFSLVYAWTFSGIRQCMAIGITTYSISFIKEKKIVKFIFCVLLASSFHITALIFLPLYFINFVSIKRKAVLFLVLVCCCFLLFQSTLISILTRYARLNYGVTEVGGQRYNLLLAVTMVGALVMYKAIKDQGTELKLEFFVAVFLPFFMRFCAINLVLYRLTWYFEVCSYVFIPNYLSLIRTKRIRIIGILIYICLYMYMVYNTVSPVSMKLSSYQSWIVS